jgi:serine/threonine protein kinase/Flp pilus assembly protein TadD
VSDAAAARWRETCRLFHELSDLAEPGRSNQLAAIGSTDPDLRKAVESLLAADDVVDERLAPLQVGISDVLRRNLTSTSQSAAVDLLHLAGEMVSHFRIIEPIAIGGMGIVYRAEDTRIGREVALKLPLVAYQYDRTGRERFLREAHTAGTLDHPNLCTIYEAGESEHGRLYLAMALYGGEPLKARIAREGALALGDAIEIARQVAVGLAFAHDAGVIHRDLKPGNIMVLPDGTAKILDFGLAKLADLGETTSGIGAIGTAAYMAPEQVRGQRVDGRADLWSLGVLLHEMLTGARPFRGDDSVSLVHAILHDDVPRLSDIKPGLPRALDAVVLALLQKDRAQRYASAHDVAADLAAIQRGATPSVRRVAKRASVWVRSRSTRTSATLAVLAIGLVATGAAAVKLISPLLQARPTTNEDAYEFYVRGREYERTGPRAVADTLYRRALALDPDFALARARLAVVHLAFTNRPDEALLAQARDEATAALQLQPDLADAHYALGVYWQRRDDHTRALAEFAKAEKGFDDLGELYGGIGTSYRSLGRWEEATVALERAVRLDPRNIVYAPMLALTYGRMRRYRESTAIWRRYIALTPDAYPLMAIKGWAYTRWKGSPDTLEAILRRMPPDFDDRGMMTYSRVYVARLRRRPADALAALAASKHSVSEDDMLYAPHSLLRGLAYASLGDSSAARAQFDVARVMMEDSVAAHPNDSRLYIALGMALAGLDRREDAVRAARRAMALAPISRDVVLATCAMGGAAEVFAYAHENDAALQLLDQLLGMPAGREASVPLLRADPAFDHIRDDPRFEQMLKRHSGS